MSDSQHSLTASFSSGSTRITRSCLTCTTRLEPRPQCGLTDLRRVSSQVRARVAERLGGERADRAQVDHVARQLGIHRLADEGDDLGMLAAADHAQLHDAGDLLAEAHAARAVDAARHVLAATSGPMFLFVTTRLSSS